jgi:hypothetical protein
MASVENLIELIATKSLISGVYNYSLYERLYTLPCRTLLNVKQVMENHIRVDKISMTKQEHLCFHP